MNSVEAAIGQSNIEHLLSICAFPVAQAVAIYELAPRLPIPQNYISKASLTLIPGVISGLYHSFQIMINGMYYNRINLIKPSFNKASDMVYYVAVNPKNYKNPCTMQTTISKIWEVIKNDAEFITFLETEFNVANSVEGLVFSGLKSQIFNLTEYFEKQCHIEKKPPSHHVNSTVNEKVPNLSLYDI